MTETSTPQTVSVSTAAPKPANNNGQQFHKRTQFQARLDNQKQQLERHGNFAEVVIRTTPEGTDMINFARLWEYVLVQADRQTRGYVAKSSRKDFEATRKDFEDCIDMMVQRLQAISKRHHLDLSGTNFISRVAQRYQVAAKVRKNQPDQQQPTNAAPAEAPVAVPAEVEKPAKKPSRAKVEQGVADEVEAL